MAEQVTAGAVDYLEKNIPPSEKGFSDGFVVQMLELEKTQGKIAKYRYACLVHLVLLSLPVCLKDSTACS